MRIRTVLSAAMALATALLLLTAAGTAVATYPGPDGPIAFTDGKGSSLQIWTMHPAGSNKTKITEPPRDNYGPSFNHTGERIVFNTIPPKGISQIYSMSHTGHLRTQITSGNRNWSHPAINHDGTRIIASGELGNGNVNLFMMHADGTHIERFSNLQKANDVDASFSPNGMTVLWERDKANGDSDILMKPAAGGPTTQLDAGNQRALSPSFSPDGTQVTFAHEIGNKGTANIKRVLTTGGGQTALTDAPTGTFFTNPVWSPNGARIAYMRLKDSNQPSDVFTMVATNGTDKQRLTDGNFLVFDLDWGRSTT